MGIEAGLYTYLNAQASVTNLVSDRIYPGSADQGSDYPKITYEVISGEHASHLTGSTNLARVLIQFDCQDKGTSALGAINLHNEVRKVTDTYEGAMGSVTVRSCLAGSPRDISVPMDDGSDEYIFTRQFDLDIWYVEDPVTV